MAAPSFQHRFEPATDAGSVPLLLLHGTGGDEDDLLPLGGLCRPGRPCSPPAARCWKAARRASSAASPRACSTRPTWCAGPAISPVSSPRHGAYGIAAPLAVGFSNGANIAAALMLLHPGVLAGAVLLRAMVPLSAPPAGRLQGEPVLILSGRMDPIVPADNAARLAGMLTQAGAAVTHEVLPAGHGLSQADLVRAKTWLTGRP